jgi:hypothetical protein
VKEPGLLPGFSFFMRVIVRGEVRRTGNEDFTFQATVKGTGEIIFCNRAPNFYGEPPALKIGDEIDIHTIGVADFTGGAPVPVWHIERPSTNEDFA